MPHPCDRRLAIEDFTTLPRRGFLGQSLARLAAGGLLVCGAARGGEAAAPAPAFQANPFALGVASGDPSPTGVVLWTRIAPMPLQGNGGMPNVAVEVEWEIAADERFRSTTARGRQIAYPELGHTVHVEVEGLEPGRDYFYRFRVGTERSATGRTRTLPAPGAMGTVRLGVVDYLFKPQELSHLIERLDLAVQRSRMLRSVSQAERAASQLSQRLHTLKQAIRHTSSVSLALPAQAPAPGAPIDPLRNLAPRDLALLSAREREVLRELARGHTPQRIAASLGLSTNTVRNHLKSIFLKLRVNSQIALLAKLATPQQ